MHRRWRYHRRRSGNEDALCLRLVATGWQRDQRVRKSLDRNLYSCRHNRHCRRGAKVADHVKCVVLVQRVLAFARHRLTSKCKCILVSGYWNVHSREIAGRSYAPFGDRYCSLTRICWPKLRFFQRQEMLYERLNVSVDCSAHCRSCIHAENCSMRRESSSETSYTVRYRSEHRSVWVFSRYYMTFNVRDSRWVLMETNTSLRSVVSGQFFIDCLPTHNTGRQHQANFPTQGGGKFCFEIWWKCTSKRAQQFLFVILMGT